MRSDVPLPLEVVMHRRADFQSARCAPGRQAMRCASLLLILFVSALRMPSAHGIERPEDALIANEIQHYAATVSRVQGDLLSLIQTASGEKRLDLYRTYNQSVGTWMQVDFLQTLLQMSIAETSAPAEQEARRALKEQASYTIWEVGQNIAELEAAIAGNKLSDDLRLHELLRSVLKEVEIIVIRLSSQP
jgi:hypothetical protein